MKEITEKTLIPISLVVVIIGGVAWFTSLYSKAASLETSLDDVKRTQESYIQYMQRIDHRLSRIEGKLGVGPKD
jgi:hypothetical protein